VVAPAGTSAEVVARLDQEIQRALASPAVRQRVAQAGAEVSFRAVVKDVKRKVLPELTDEWVAELAKDAAPLDRLALRHSHPLWVARALREDDVAEVLRCDDADALAAEAKELSDDLVVATRWLFHSYGSCDTDRPVRDALELGLV